MRFWKNVLLIGIGGIFLLLGAYIALALYSNRVADRDAHKFCGDISIGSNIAAATALADRREILWGKDGGNRTPPSVTGGANYDFYFFGAGMDKAVCEVSVDGAAHVRSKHPEVEPD